MMRISPGPCLGVFFGLISRLGAAQTAADPATLAPLTLSQCYRALAADSVAFYYDPYYHLVPPGCAAIRRHARVDSAGHFRGPVRDYRLTNNVLLLAGAYRDGRKHGRFELFYPDGAPAARGNYYQGQPVGDWAYWYPGGQPRQIVRFELGQPPRLQRFWNSSGVVLVAEGQGEWEQADATTRLAGPISQGLAQGRWERRFLRGRQLYAVEYFDQGTFRKGSIYYAPGPGEEVIPLDMEQPPFLDVEDFDQAERLVLGAPCPAASPTPPPRP